ncbi:MAG: hypothetical protein AAB510_01345 [Patescibacteria group bacterium]
MFADENDFKISSEVSPTSIKDSKSPISYKKLNKLITAVYIVTDIMNKDEPIRSKIRALGLELISDIHSISKTDLYYKIDAILSFLDISATLSLISPMNFNILKKEFTQFSHSLLESNKVNTSWLEDFLLNPEKEEDNLIRTSRNDLPNFSRVNNKGNLFIHKGHSIGQSINKKVPSTRLGVQDAGSLMRVLSDKTRVLSDKSSNVIKEERRKEILSAIKDIPGDSTITDIRKRVSKTLSGLSEKTLQRELVAMVKEGVLNKTGEKRWSKYKIIDFSE